jgi:hypothetical protein
MHVNRPVDRSQPRLGPDLCNRRDSNCGADLAFGAQKGRRRPKRNADSAIRIRHHSGVRDLQYRRVSARSDCASGLPPSFPPGRLGVGLIGWGGG